MNTATGTWHVVDSECEDAETLEVRLYINVAPDFGPEHEYSPDCWCHPHVADDGVITHNVMH